MLSDATASGLLGLPKHLADFAEVLGGLLIPKLNETLLVAFASEAEMMRADLRCALKEFRNDFRSEGLESVQSSHRQPAPKQARTLATITSLDVLPALSGVSSDSGLSSSTSKPARHAMPRLPSIKLERQLAEKVIEAKLFSRGTTGEQAHLSITPWRRGTSRNSEGQLSQSTNRSRMPSAFNQVVPSDTAHQFGPGDTSRPPFVVEGETVGKSSTMTPTAANPCRHCSSSSASIQITNQNRLDHSQLSSLPIVDDSEDASSAHSVCTSTVANRGSKLSLRYHRPDTGAATTPLNRWRNEAIKFYDQTTGLSGEWWGPARRINATISRALGLLPWDVKFYWLSKTYQVFFLGVLLVSTLNVVTKFSINSIESYTMDSFTRLDDILAVGSLLGFLASFVKNQSYVGAQLLVESHLSRSGFLEELNWKSCVENCFLLFVWLSCVASRLYATSFDLHVSDVALAFNVLALLGTCAYVLRLCRSLHFIADSFCQYMVENDFDVEDAMKEWFLVHCTIRTACESLQLCFLALQFTAIGIVLFAASSIRSGNAVLEESTIVICIPGALCIVVLMHLSMRAGSVSDVCKRVPILVNSSNAEFDLKRMYLVEYIVNCETGFYVYEVNLSSGMLCRIFYVACAAALALLAQVWKQLG